VLRSVCRVEEVEQNRQNRVIFDRLVEVCGKRLGRSTERTSRLDKVAETYLQRSRRAGSTRRWDATIRMAYSPASRGLAETLEEGMKNCRCRNRFVRGSPLR
jgi:hypothetical protein